MIILCYLKILCKIIKIKKTFLRTDRQTDGQPKTILQKKNKKIN